MIICFTTTKFKLQKERWQSGFNASVLKTEVLKSTVGSNPTLSSIKMDLRDTNHKRLNTGKRKPSLPIKPEGKSSRKFGGN